MALWLLHDQDVRPLLRPFLQWQGGRPLPLARHLTIVNNSCAVPAKPDRYERDRRTQRRRWPS